MLESTPLSAATAVPVDGLAGWAVGLMESLGGPGAALVVALDNLFPPIPSELILPLVGFTASRGRSACLRHCSGRPQAPGSALVVYVVGALLGRTRTRSLVTSLPLLRESDFDKSEAWFAGQGPKAVLLGWMLPLVRSFLVLTTIGSLAWNTIFVMTGYALGESWYLVEGYASVLQRMVVVVAVVAFVVLRLRSRSGSAGR